MTSVSTKTSLTFGARLVKSDSLSSVNINRCCPGRSLTSSLHEVVIYNKLMQKLDYNYVRTNNKVMHLALKGIEDLQTGDLDSLLRADGSHRHHR